MAKTGTSAHSAAERVLTVRALNRALLARQLLLERRQLSVPRAVEQIGGVQAQYAPSAYVGLWSRLSGFEREDLTRALERRTVVQGTLLRETIHIVSRREYWTYALGSRTARRAWWLRVHGGAEESSVRLGGRKARKLLAQGPLRRSELQAALEQDEWRGLGNWLDLVRVPPSGTWERRRADLYATAENWIGAPDTTELAGLALLVRRYLGAFGPAAPADIARWAGTPMGAVTRVLPGLRLRRFLDEQGRELVDLPRAPLPDPETPAPVRYLATWDATLLVHARRTQILPEELRPSVFHVKVPQSVSTFLVDGQVAGVWRIESGRMQLEPLVKLSRETRRQLVEEGERLAAFYA